MKHAILRGLAAAAIAVPLAAQAADMPVKAPVYKAPPPEPVFSWTGFYIGVNAGGSWSDEGINYANPFTTAGNIFATCAAPAGVAAVPVLTVPNPFNLSTDCSSAGSFLGGAQIGYNWQSGAIVYGLEADAMWRRLKEHSFVEFGANPAAGAPFGSVATDTAYFRSEQNALGTIRGRLGYAPSNWLLYVTGGLAVGGVKHSVTEVLSPGTTCVLLGGATCRDLQSSTTKVGWTVGAGAEVALGTQWSIGVEYLFVDLGRTTLNLASLGPAGPGNFFFNASTARFDDRSHIARVKLNYRWGGAGPVVAAY
jgi:outer membrane immunogenic protein